MNKSKPLKNYSQSIIHNFELSFIMPFYKKLREFTRVLPLNAPYFQRNGIEVIIVMDEPTEENGVIGLIRKYPFINWKLIVNDTKHESRNPAKVLNVGIRHATKKYVMVSSPETQLYTDVIFQLRNKLENYPGHYAIGTVAFIQEDTLITDETVHSLWFLPYGSIMTKKEYLEKVSGYDESFEKWGGDDDNIRKRLDMAGIRKLLVPESKSLHLEKELKLAERINTADNFPPQHSRKIHQPVCIEANSPGWGNDFNRVAFNWQDNRFAEELCRDYLKTFTDFKINDNAIYRQNYKKIILCQSYNEAELIAGFLENMAMYFDGIILLDDGSTDGTYELANHPKLLIKTKKSHEDFNDLANRNILLNIASFFNAEWFCYMDIDERFDERFTDFQSITIGKDIDVAAFCFVHLWDNDNFYNAEYPYTMNGLFWRKRMFRNIGRTQINTSFKKLHFEPTPIKNGVINSSVLVKHLGNLTREKRWKRYHSYMKVDKAKDQQSYEHILKEKPKLNKVNEINIELITSYAKHYKY